MSIIIKGMDMPKSCEECRFHINEIKIGSKSYPCKAYCFATQSKEKRSICPLIEIVTCKECNRSGTDGENTFCMWMGALRKPTDFCSYGERRKDESIY